MHRINVLAIAVLVFAELPARAEPAMTASDPSQDKSSTRDAVYRVGNGVTPASVVSKVDPEYSEEAREARISGTVLISFIVDIDGRAADIKVVKNLGFGLDEKAMDAVKHWRFRPGSKDGRPVNTYATSEVNFIFPNGNNPPTAISRETRIEDPAHNCDGSAARMDLCADSYMRHGVGLKNEMLAEPFYRRALEILEQAPHTGQSLAFCLELEARALRLIAARAIPRPNPLEFQDGLLRAKTFEDRAFALRQKNVSELSASNPKSAPRPGADENVYFVGNGVTAPSVISKYDPHPPAMAELAGFTECTVRLSLVVEPNGLADSIALLKGCGLGLDEEAAAALANWRFTPGAKGGTPIRVKSSIEFAFKP